MIMKEDITEVIHQVEIDKIIKGLKDNNIEIDEEEIL